jgi:hypothetical protein
MIKKLKERIEQKKKECLERARLCKRKGMDKNFHMISAYNEVLKMISNLENSEEDKAFADWKKDQTYEEYLLFKELLLSNPIIFNTKVRAPYEDFGNYDILEICPDGITLNDDFKVGDNVKVIIAKDNKQEQK